MGKGGGRWEEGGRKVGEVGGRWGKVEGGGRSRREVGESGGRREKVEGGGERWEK